jgi:hypothetical protein
MGGVVCCNLAGCLLDILERRVEVLSKWQPCSSGGDINANRRQDASKTKIEMEKKKDLEEEGQ